MSAILIQLAEAVKEELNAQTFSQPFTATRGYLVTAELKDLKTLDVVVAPRSETAEISDRSGTAHVFHIDVGVRKRVDSIEPATLDPLADLVAELIDHFRFFDFDTPVQATWFGTEHGTPDRPAYIQEHLETFRQFTSVFTLAYHVHQ